MSHADPRYTLTSACLRHLPPDPTGTDVAYFGGSQLRDPEQLYPGLRQELHETHLRREAGFDFKTALLRVHPATRSYTSRRGRYAQTTPPTTREQVEGPAAAPGRRRVRRRANRFAKRDMTLQDPQSVWQAPQQALLALHAGDGSSITGIPVAQYLEVANPWRDGEAGQGHDHRLRVGLTHHTQAPADPLRRPPAAHPRQHAVRGVD